MTEAEKDLTDRGAPLSHAQCIELAALIAGLRAHGNRLHAVLEREVMKLSADRSWCTLCRTESFDRKAAHPHHPSCALVHQPEEPQPTPERLMLVEIASHLSMLLGWAFEPATVDVEWVKNAISQFNLMRGDLPF